LSLSPENRLISYDPEAVERKWQRRWADDGTFQTPSPDGRPSTYVFTGCPFTTGDAHMGHVRSYAISDAFARYRRSRGDAVLFSLGFDSFGLPAELEARKRDLEPADWVQQCGARMRGQFDRLGFSFDWERSFDSSEPAHYRWSQWLFLALLERDLIYQRDAQVIWCGSCRTVLAALQAEGDTCWRCHSAIELRRMPQWFFRVSAFVEHNETALRHLDGWDRAALGSQRAILGRVDGFDCHATLPDGRSMVVFATSVAAVSEANAIAVSPNHPDVDSLVKDPGTSDQLKALRQTGRRRADRARTDVIRTGTMVRVAGAAEPLEIVVSPQVDSRFGPTAALQNIDGFEPKSSDGLPLDARPQGELRTAARYRAQDFPISRQRAWGAPIPLVHCVGCGTVPVPYASLPVELPEPRNGGSLSTNDDFRRCDCPRCGAPAERETDTLDCHVDALWMWLPICVPVHDRKAQMFDHPELRRWLPIRQIVWGSDAGGYLFDQRATARFLQDAGVLPQLPLGEPFVSALMHQMVQMDGRKMSKHLGNVVSPQQLIDESGADAVRFAVLAATSPAKAFSWDAQMLANARRFLDDLWTYAAPRLREWGRINFGGALNRDDRRRRQLARWSSTALTKTAAAYDRLEMQRVASNLKLLLARIQEFERHARDRDRDCEFVNDQDRRAVVDALTKLVIALAPVAPHIAEELWEAAGNDEMLSTASWPATEGN
jgi:leucyl-tRNA synthetase